MKTSSAATSYEVADDNASVSGNLTPTESVILFHGANAYPNFRDYDFNDFDGNNQLITTKWPTTIEGYTIRRNGTLVGSGTRD